MTEIKDFIVYYPPIKDKDFTEKITHLKEFSTLQLDANEENIPGQLLNHQEMSARYYDSITSHDVGYIFQRPGTGKTHILSMLVERSKRNIVNGKQIKPALVLVRNKSLRNHLRQEIAYKITKDLYIPSSTRKESAELHETGIVDIGEESRIRRMNEAISKFYRIMTYGELLDKKRFPSDEKIERDYSNRWILIDEAQNIRQQPDKKKKLTRYNNFHHFLHTIKNCHIYMFTGSPIWDKVHDIAGLLNLTLPMDKQLPTQNAFTKAFFDKNNDLKPEKEKELKGLMKGKITFLRPLMSSAMRDEIGIKSPWLKYVKIYPSMMAKEQSEVANAVLNRKDANFENSAFLTDARDVSNGVYPVFDNDGNVIRCEYGVKTFELYAVTTTLVKDKKGGYNTGKMRSNYGFNNNRLKEELGPAKGPDIYANIRKYSSKMTAILKMLRDPARKKEKVFIFLESVRGTGGALSYALILQLWGYNWMKSPRKNSKIPDTFIVLTSDPETISTTGEMKEAFEIANGDDNIYGEKIRIVIGTEAISQGYTLKAFRQGHFGQAAWNFSSEDQAMGRIFRFGAHSQLTFNLEQLDKNEAYLNIYRHAALDGYSGDTKNQNNKNKFVHLPEGVSDPSGGIFSTKDTVDIHIYKIAETKEYMTSQIIRLIKESAWDCALAYKRNVLANDINESRECDFKDCNYQCDDYPDVSKTKGEKFVKKGQGYIWSYEIDPDKVDPTNYNILYAEKDVKKYVTEIVDLFHNFFALELNVIMELINCNDLPLLLKALTIVINNRIPIRNRFGIWSYLKENKDIYFLDFRITSDTNYLSCIYTTYPFVTEKNKLDDIIEVKWLEKDEGRIPELMSKPKNTFDKLSYRTKIVVVEASVELSYKNENIENSAIIKTIMESTEGKALYKLSDGNVAHILYNTEYTGVGYNVISQSLQANGKMRVFNIISKTWDYVNPNKEQEYLSEIKILIKKSSETKMLKNEYDLYGSTSQAGAFKIIDKRKQTARTGRVCDAAGFSIGDIYEIFHRIGHFPYDDEVDKYETARDLNKEAIVEILRKDPKFMSSPFVDEIDEMTEDQVQRLYCLTSMTKQELCKSLERWFKGDNSKNLVIYG